MIKPKNDISSTIDWDKLDKMSEDEIKEFEFEYKQKYFPQWRLYSLIGYNVFVAGLTMYYTVNFRKFSKKLFKPKSYGLGEIFKYGTIQSLIFVSIYCLGTSAVTGLWQPIQYVQNLAKIKGKVIDKTIRHDEIAQKYLLYNAMEYFGMSKEIVQKAKEQLENEKQELENSGFFSKDTLELMNSKDEIQNDKSEQVNK